MLSRLTRISAHITPIAGTKTTTTPLRLSTFPNFRYLNGVMSPSTGHQQGRLYQSAACLIIGDEVLNGKIIDTNSTFLAKYLFNLGIPLQRVETIPDVESEIISSIQRLSSNYDFVVTSGGIGPTHDDITYPSIARAYNLPLQHHTPTIARMKLLASKRSKKEAEIEQDWDTPSPQLDARLRMALLPVGDGVEYLFVDEELWVPVVVVNRNIHILPGIPKLFETLMKGLANILLERGNVEPQSQQWNRIIISTPLPESAVAEYLTELQKKVESKGIKVGSYPRWEKKRNTVTLVGRDAEYLESLVPEVEKGVQGVRVKFEGEDDEDEEEDGGLGKKVEVLKEAGEKLEKIELREEERAVDAKKKEAEEK